MLDLNRRDFITLLGSAAAWPLPARAQQPAMPVIGFLNGQSEAGYRPMMDAFRRGIEETGYVEGQNVMIEVRWANGQFDRLPALADDLIRRRVAVLVLSGGSSQIAKAVRTPIPIVCTAGGDPVQLGLAASLNHPGGNITGMTVFTANLEAKRLELMHELVPRAASIGVLLDPKFESGADAQQVELQAAARRLGREIRIVHASAERDIDAAFVSLIDMHVGALVVTGSPVFLNWRDRLLALTTRHALPAIYESREFTRAGGLMSYGTNVPDVYRQLGVYSGRILKGEKPAELPFLQPTKFDVAVNLKTAKALGVEVPTSILLRADEVIE